MLALAEMRSFGGRCRSGLRSAPSSEPLLPLAAIDVLEQRLPAKLLMPAYRIVAALLALAAIAEHTSTAILRSLAGMIFLLVFYLIIALAAPGALGAADIRLAG